MTIIIAKIFITLFLIRHIFCLMELLGKEYGGLKAFTLKWRYSVGNAAQFTICMPVELLLYPINFLVFQWAYYSAITRGYGLYLYQIVKSQDLAEQSNVDTKSEDK